MRTRMWLALSVSLVLLASVGAPALAGSDPIKEAVYDAKYAAMDEVDEAVDNFYEDIYSAPDQAARDAVLAAALEDIDTACKDGADAINLIVEGLPLYRDFADGAIAYLEDYSHDAMDEVIAVWEQVSGQSTTTTTSTTSTTSTTTTTLLPPPPWILIQSPRAEAVFTEPTVTFTGGATPGAVVTVGPYPASTDGEGNWSINLVLVPGRNVATVRATNAGGTATDSVVVYYEVSSTTTTSTTSTTTPSSTTTSTTTSTTSTTLPGSTPTTTVPTTTTTTTIAAAAGPGVGGPSGPDPASSSAGESDFSAAFAPVFDDRPDTSPAAGVILAEAGTLALSGAAAVSASNEAFAMIRPVIPYVLEEPVFSVFAVIEMIGRALTASVRNLLGPAIVTLGYLVVSMVRRRRSIVA